jgi:YXWGXW repeat-containing protein
MQLNKTLIALGIAASSLGATVATAADVYVQIGPPPPRHEVVVEKRGYAWTPGYWNWNGHHYVWVKGRNVRVHHGEHWVPDHWVEDNGRWHREHGRWDRG